MGGFIGEALRVIFMQIFVKRKGIRLNSVSIMYYVSPFSALCLFMAWIFLEKLKMELPTAGAGSQLPLHFHTQYYQLHPENVIYNCWKDLGTLGCRKNMIIILLNYLGTWKVTDNTRSYCLVLQLFSFVMTKTSS